MCDFDSQNDPRSQIMHMKKIQAEGLELFIKKNADYGSSYKQYGLIGVLVRLQDKINRALHITQHGIHVKDETLRDTLIDLHNYAAMALMESESEPTVPSLPSNQNHMVPSLPSNQNHMVPSLPSNQNHMVPSLHSNQNNMVPSLHSNQNHMVPNIPITHSSEHPAINSKSLLHLELPQVQKSISDPPRKSYDYLGFDIKFNEAYDECNHRNINLR